MRENPAKRRLRDGQVTLGSWLHFDSQLSARVMAGTGWEWLLIDMEHGPISAPAAHAMIVALLGTGAAPFVRVTWNESSIVQSVLDMGAYGLIVPMISSRAQAQAAVRDAKYPPLGERSRGGIGAQMAFATDNTTYGRAANDETLLCVQLETVEAVRNAAAIAEVPGVDVLFVGPNDLADSFGYWPMDWTIWPWPADYLAAMTRIPQIARAAGKHAGLLAFNAQMANRCIELGYTFVAVQGDSTLLTSASKALFGAINREPARATS